MVYRYSVRKIDFEKIVGAYDRVYFSKGFFYVPWIVAERLQLGKGKVISGKELRDFLIKEWDRMPTLFKKYAISSARELSLLFLFKGGTL